MRDWGGEHRYVAMVRPDPWQSHARYILHLHDHLATSEEGVADELARAQSNLRVGHIEEIRPGTRQYDARCLGREVRRGADDVLDRDRSCCCRYAVVLAGGEMVRS